MCLHVTMVSDLDSAGHHDQVRHHRLSDTTLVARMSEHFTS